jgi:hypothetical protein
MLPSLSDRTKSFIAVSAVLAVALCNVVFGMDWVSEQGARRAAATAGVTDTPIVAAPPAADGGQPMNGNAAQMIEPVAPAAPAAAEAPQPKCDVTACAEAYRSFRTSDCTYMPSAGVRRLCTKGTPPQ